MWHEVQTLVAEILTDIESSVGIDRTEGSVSKSIVLCGASNGRLATQIFNGPAKRLAKEPSGLASPGSTAKFQLKAKAIGCS